MASITIVKPGFLTTVQDLGRFYYRKDGISVAGAMDSLSFRLANILLGNDENSAALEVTLIGPTIRFTKNTAFTITGGNLSPTLNGEAIPLWQVVTAQVGDQLSFGAIVDGCRAYIAFQGGINVPFVMGSRSTYLRGNYGGFNGRALIKGDQLFLNQPSKSIKYIRGRKLRPDDIPDFHVERPIRFIPGPHYRHFTEASMEEFLTSNYKITVNSDRMGYRLSGEKLIHKGQAGIISGFIIPGTIQVPGDGDPIIHMVDCATTGGYKNLGVIISSDLPYIAQKKPYDNILLQTTDLSTAHWELKRYEKYLFNLRINNLV